MNTNKWSDIGYSFLVGNDGNVYEGRGWSRVGAHTSGYNNDLAASFIGTFTDQLPISAALNAAKNLIQCGVDKGYIKSSYTLHGHRDVSSTTCPGNMLYAEIRKWPHYQSNP
ncbi:peptidoglycan recognition protein 1-like [Saccostrea cucullata]|uniref:peptidoglycan recognition protein 1-like n=1 Tax=Saccostrea cuccullata TaxID=36930 RepID=UPI002ED68F7C